MIRSIPIPPTLDAYSVDRAAGATADGLTEVVVLVLRADGRENAYTISKADALMIGQLLINAAQDAQSVMHKKI